MGADFRNVPVTMQAIKTIGRLAELADALSSGGSAFGRESSNLSATTFGEVGERFKPAVLKTAGLQGPGGSNPSFSGRWCSSIGRAAHL